MRSKNIFFLCIPIIFLLCTPLLFHFRPGYTLNGVDAYFPLNPIQSLKNTLQIWQTDYFCGYLKTDVIARIPSIIYWYTLYKLGWQVESIQKVYYVSLFFIMAISVWWIANVATNNRVAALLASLAYLYNPYVMSRLERLEICAIEALAFMPLFFMLVYLLLSVPGRREKIRVISFFPIVLSLGSIVFTTPPIAFGAILPGITYGFYFMLSRREGVQLLYLAYAGVIMVLISSFWLIPMCYMATASNTFSIASNTGQNILHMVNMFSADSSLNNSIRLLGDWGWQLPDAREYTKIYKSNTYLIFCSYFMPIFAFGTLLFKKNYQRPLVIFFLILAIIGIFLGKGLHPPLESIYGFLYTRIPGFWIFRNAYGKFTPLIAFTYAILTAIFFKDITEIFCLKRIHYWICWVGMALVITSMGFPLFTFPESFLGRDMHLKVPDWYYEAAAYVKNKNNVGRLLFLPPRSSNVAGYAGYNWSNFSGVDFCYNLFSRDRVVASFGSDMGQQSVAYQNLFSRFLFLPGGQFEKFVKQNSINYIVLQKDLQWQYGGASVYSPSKIQKFLSQQRGHFSLMLNLDKVLVYEKSVILPSIYAIDPNSSQGKL